MSKALPAQCALGVVVSQGFPVPSAEILSEGVGPSEGVLVLDEDKAFYIPKTAPDLKTTLETISSALTQIVTALSLIDAKPAGALPPAPVAAAAIAQITAANVQIAALKEILK